MPLASFTSFVIDKRKNVLKLARPLHKSIKKYGSNAFQFSEPAELLLPELDDLKLFRKYFRHCPNFCDPTAPHAKRAARRGDDETAADVQRDTTL